MLPSFILLEHWEHAQVSKLYETSLYMYLCIHTHQCYIHKCLLDPMHFPGALGNVWRAARAQAHNLLHELAGDLSPIQITLPDIAQVVLVFHWPFQKEATQGCPGLHLSPSPFCAACFEALSAIRKNYVIHALSQACLLLPGGAPDA